MLDKTLYVLTGPTAVGKTALSLEWAQKNDAEIVYCDSTVIYKGMDIGTAKPTAAERALVAHHGLDLIDLTQVFSIQDYQQWALKTIQAIHARGKKVLVTGGSGFYLKSFFSAVIDDIVVEESIKNRVQALFETEGLLGLIRVLKEKSPDSFGRLDIHNPRRVIKALERVLMTGLSLLELEANWAKQQSLFVDYVKAVTLFKRDPEDLKMRIEQRVYAMMAAGFVEEVQSLIKKGICEHPVARHVIGYREIIDYLTGHTASDAELIQLIIQHTHQLVKKQHTFFKYQIPINTVINLNS